MVLAVVIVAVMILIKCRAEPMVPPENDRRLTMDEVSKLAFPVYMNLL